MAVGICSARTDTEVVSCLSSRGSVRQRSAIAQPIDPQVMTVWLDCPSPHRLQTIYAKAKKPPLRAVNRIAKTIVQVGLPRSDEQRPAVSDLHSPGRYAGQTVTILADHSSLILV